MELTNIDSVPHFVTSDGTMILSLAHLIQYIVSIPSRQKFTFIFTVQDVYPFHFEPHPWMQGKVTIAEVLASVRSTQKFKDYDSCFVHEDAYHY
jgi:plastocyanin